MGRDLWRLPGGSFLAQKFLGKKWGSRKSIFPYLLVWTVITVLVVYYMQEFLHSYSRVLSISVTRKKNCVCKLKTIKKWNLKKKIIFFHSWKLTNEMIQLVLHRIHIVLQYEHTCSTVTSVVGCVCQDFSLNSDSLTHLWPCLFMNSVYFSCTVEFSLLSSHSTAPWINTTDQYNTLQSIT